MRSAKNLGALSRGGRYNQVKCASCGREFIIPCDTRDYPLRRDQYGHKRNYFCSWSCMRAWDQEHPRRESIYLDYLS